MHIDTHTINEIKIAEITAGGLLIHSAEDGLDLLGSIYYQGFDKLIIHE